MELKDITRVFEIPCYQLEKFPKEDALSDKINGKWEKHSTKELIDKANAFSCGLLKLGIRAGDKIAMISNNRSEWNMADIGILQIGAVNIPIYPTISEEDYKYIFNHAEVKLCFVSDKDLLEKVNRIWSGVPTLTGVYTFNNIEGARHWSEILEQNNSRLQGDVEKIKQNVKAEDLATIIYTSGTTGTPKGVMISHRNIVSNVVSCIVSRRLTIGEYGRSLSFLPVCHVYERLLIYMYMLNGVSVYFAENMETIGDNLREVKPHVFTAVPRLLEKVYDKIVAKGSELTGIKHKLFFWALKLGQRYEPYGANGWWYELQLGIANKLIFSKWREALGGNVELVASGSAALQPRLARVFNAAGIPVMEGYGLTETAVVVSVGMIKDRGLMFGATGRPIKDVQVKIAEDGEILIKGPSIMIGYYKQPELTKQVIDADGWFHTGDIGELVNGGFVKITDRKKEIFKTSGGKYIAPQPMENKFKESLFIEQVMVIGENRKHPAALIVPAFLFLKDWCGKNGIEYTTNEKIVKNESVKNRILQEIENYNAGFGKWEQVKKIELIPHDWTIAGGELTPTLKLKRKEIMNKYKDLVDMIYVE